MRTLFFIGEVILNSISSLIEIIFFRTPKKEGYDADFLPVTDIMSRYNKGFALTGNRSITTKDSHTHAIIMGGSGSGKSTTVLIPTLFNMARHGHSIVVHDPSGELLQASGGYLAECGYDTKVLHFANPSISDGYNPLQRLETISDIMKVSTMLVRNTLGTSSNDSFWNSQAASFIALLIAILKKQDAPYCNLANCKYLLDQYQADPQVVDKLVVKSKDANVLREYKIFLKYDPKVMSNIIATCRSALQMFNDNHVQLVTSFDSIDFAQFREHKTALFIQNRTADMRYYSVLTSIFTEQFFGEIMTTIPNKKARSIFFLLDECSSLYLPTLQIALANLRKYKAGAMLVLQDFNQLRNLYGAPEAEAMRANCFAKVYFPGQPIDTCREIETLLGKREYQDKEGRKHTRQLMTADEIRTLKQNRAIIFCGSNRAIYARMKPYYKHWKYRTYGKLSMPPLTSKLTFDTVPLLNT